MPQWTGSWSHGVQAISLLNSSMGFVSLICSADLREINFCEGVGNDVKYFKSPEPKWIPVYNENFQIIMFQ